MPELIKRGAAWLGLVADNRYDDRGEPVDAEVTEAVYDAYPLEADEPSASIHQLPTRAPEPEPAPVLPPAPRPADLSRIITVHPRTFNDAKTIGEHFRDAVPVIMNVTEMEDSDAKRLVDFAAGLIFGLRGTFERVSNKVFLLSPREVVVTAEDKERIAGGFYNQS
ncbi:MAG: cell division protein SepF [Actinomycetia bacterium]|nr:cell division protein SepF [Actinomycetes bacterium]